MNESPKGEYRMWHVGAIALFFLGLSAWQSGVSDYVWFWETVHSVGRVGGAIFALYYSGRALAHFRSHELLGVGQKELRDNVMIIAGAIVLCGVFAGL